MTATAGVKLAKLECQHVPRWRLIFSLSSDAECISSGTLPCDRRRLKSAGVLSNHLVNHRSRSVQLLTRAAMGERLHSLQPYCFAPGGSRTAHQNSTARCLAKFTKLETE